MSFHSVVLYILIIFGLTSIQFVQVRLLQLGRYEKMQQMCELTAPLT